MNAQTAGLSAQTAQITVPPDRIPVHDAQRLTEGGVQARVVLGDQTYLLRITRAGKLILTK